MVGRRQVERHGTLDPALVGSNPTAPARIRICPKRPLASTLNEQLLDSQLLNRLQAKRQKDATEILSPVYPGDDVWVVFLWTR